MAWLRIDDNAPQHPKMIRAGGAACWLWLSGNAYCSRQQTDGRIPKEAVPLFMGGTPANAARLVAVGLWHDQGDHYLVHDYLDWNDSAAIRQAKTQQRNDRVTRFRQRQERDRNANATPPPTPSPSPTPQPTPATAQDAVAPREARPPRAPAGPAGLVTSPGRWGVEHAHHVTGFCDWVCLPTQVFDGCVARVVGAGASPEDAADQVRRWAQSVRDRWSSSGQIPGDDIFAFWRHEWAAANTSNRPAAASTRGHAAGLDRIIAQGGRSHG